MIQATAHLYLAVIRWVRLLPVSLCKQEYLSSEVARARLQIFEEKRDCEQSTD